jgi:4-hydroxy-tetrahydrodipicolinate reductase
LKFALVGHGKMGRAVEEQAGARGHEVVGRFDLEDAEAISAERLAGVEVAFEFSVPDAAARNVRALLDAGVSVVCGTTGWTPSPEINELARERRVGAVVAPNFSIGMNLFYRLVRETGRILGAAGQHEPYVVETHHRAKLDCPSGTARRLAEILVQSDPRVSGAHEGNPPEPLPPDLLHVASVRAGHEPGTHVVGYDGKHDAIVLRHTARGREGLALGAVMAAEWVQGKSGLFTFEPVIDELLESSRRE